MHMHFIFSLFSAIYSQILVLQCVKVTSHQPKTTFRLRQDRLGFLFFFLQILQFTDTRTALSQSQKARRVAVTVIRSCEATREARSGTRRMTVPLPFQSERALPISKSAENRRDCHSKLQSDAQSAEWSAEDDSALLFETRLLQKGAQRIIVTDVFRCISTRTAHGGARKTSVYSRIPVSCLVSDEAIIIIRT